MIPLFKVFMSPEVEGFVSSTLASGTISQGHKVEIFERRLNELWGRKTVVTTNSCTSAIHLAYDLIKRDTNISGGEVIASPHTCAAGIFPALAHGFKVTWADIDEYLNIDLDCVQQLMTSQTQILTFVHWGGRSIDYDKLDRLKLWYRRTFDKPLYVIEDCAHVFNNRWDGTQTSTIQPDNFKCYSFQAIKHLTCGDGGALICPDEFYKKAKLKRWFGLDRDQDGFRGGQDIEYWGYKFHMNDISAAIGLANLSYVASNVEKARRNSAKYFKGIKSKFVTTSCADSSWLFTILVKNRPKFIQHMRDHMIETSPVHSRVDANTCMKESIPCSGHIDRVDKEMVSIPVGWWLTEDEVTHIINVVNEYNPN